MTPTAPPDLTEFDELARLQRGLGRPCPIAELKLPSKERAVLDAALATEAYPNALIMRWLERRGLPISNSAINSHRKGNCRCAKKALLRG
jgi:hypothetical protein